MCLPTLTASVIHMVCANGANLEWKVFLYKIIYLRQSLYPAVVLWLPFL